nr:MAG TPA: hypothetical protein [Caudoviricetes sp.]
MHIKVIREHLILKLTTPICRSFTYITLGKAHLLGSLEPTTGSGCRFSRCCRNHRGSLYLIFMERLDGEFSLRIGSVGLSILDLCVQLAEIIHSVAQNETGENVLILTVVISGTDTYGHLDLVIGLTGNDLLDFRDISLEIVRDLGEQCFSIFQVLDLDPCSGLAILIGPVRDNEETLEHVHEGSLPTIGLPHALSAEPLGNIVRKYTLLCILDRDAGIFPVFVYHENLLAVIGNIPGIGDEESQGHDGLNTVALGSFSLHKEGEPYLGDFLTVTVCLAYIDRLFLRS